MGPPCFNRQPPKSSSGPPPPPPYREMSSPPPYPDAPSPEYLNEMFRCFYLRKSYRRKSRDGWMATLNDFIAENTDYNVEFCDNDESLRIILPEACYMSMEFEELRNIRKRLKYAAIEGKLFRYWEVDLERNDDSVRGLIKAKLRNEYQNRLKHDEEFRRNEATKTASLVSAELNVRVASVLLRW